MHTFSRAWHWSRLFPRLRVCFVFEFSLVCFVLSAFVLRYTVFTRISAAALIIKILKIKTFFAPQMRRLFKGGAYLRAALI